MRRKVDGALVGVGLFVVVACGSESGDGGEGQAEAGSSNAGSGGDGSGRGGTSGTGDAGSGGTGGVSTSGAGGSAAASGSGGTSGDAGAPAGGGSDDGGASGASDDGGASGLSATGGSAGAQGGSAGAQGGSAGAQGGSAGSGAEMVTLTIEFIGDVPGEIVNSFSAFICTETCTRTLPRNHQDTYRARPENGAGTYFAGFGGDCSGIAECAITMDEDKHVTVEFREQTHNFVFLSSRSEYTDLGGAERFDESCNELATSAGINNTTNDGYIAWISDDDSLALDRLGATARGWVRLDGKPVVDTVADLLAGKLIHTVRVDDEGVTHDNGIVATGTLADGSAAPDNCNDWTSEASGYDFAYGANYGGPTYWTELGTRGCNIGVRFYCLGTTLSQPIALTPEAGKLIYLSEPYTPNPDTTPDEACAASAPSGSGEVRAMLAYDDKAGADVLTNGTRYVRPDGQFLGFGAEIVEAASPGVQGSADDYLQTGIWQTGDGTYLNESDSAVWVGDINITRAILSECDTFTSTTGSATVGDYRNSGSGFWDQEYGDRYRNCSTPHRFYCVEQ
jgi:hypothetical protein